MHAALEGEAVDFLEDVPAKVWGAETGWQVLIKILRDTCDEPTINKVGTAMRNFFQRQIATGKALNMRDIAEYNGQSSPDIHPGASTERQANLLLRTQGKYDWKRLKTAIDILYPNVHRGRGAHEVQHQSDQWMDWAAADEGIS